MAAVFIIFSFTSAFSRLKKQHMPLVTISASQFEAIYHTENANIT